MVRDGSSRHAALRQAARILASRGPLPPWALDVQRLVGDGLAQLEGGAGDGCGPSGRITTPRRVPDAPLEPDGARA